MTSIRLRICSAITLAVLMTQALQADEPTAEALAFFERDIRPLLVKKCQGCHGEKKQESGLRLDSHAAALKGNDDGAVIVPGKPSESRLIAAVRRTGDSPMPPDDPLSPAQVATLEKWIEVGAPWTKETNTSQQQLLEKQRNHWAFKPVTNPSPPTVQNETWVRNDVDRFVLSKLEAAKLAPAPEADRRTLIRRVTYDLTGLPPTPEEVDAFVADDSPEAYQRLIDRLLESPHYGEHWGRFWLDIARYADTKGYVYGREERFFTHASRYRDWVVAAFNDDMPYDRFLLLQIAGEQVAPDEHRHRAALGFFTLGRRFIGVPFDIIDDRIDMVTRATMGLTAACARCHDHKFDPIPTADYYSLYGVFQNTQDELVPLDPAAFDRELASDSEFGKNLRERLSELATHTAARKKECDDSAIKLIPKYLLAQKNVASFPSEGFDQVLANTDLLPPLVRKWQGYLESKARESDPIFSAWRAFFDLPEQEFANLAAERLTRWKETEAKRSPPQVVAAFGDAPKSLAEVAERYGKVFADIDARWNQYVATTQPGTTAPLRFPDDQDEALRRVIRGADSPCVLPQESIYNIETIVNTGAGNEIWRHQMALEQLLMTRPEGSPLVMAVRDRDRMVEPRIFKRGNSLNKGAPVPRQFLSVVAGASRQPFQHGSGRLELAEGIVSPDNPLTARVWANRVWDRHFGQGLVMTPSDFGTRAEAPSHPELLDWLARQLIEHGWSTKRLHRLLLNSATYRQQSSASEEAIAAARNIDPENRLLWHMPVHRLNFEEMRDSILMATGELDLTPGGKAVDMFANLGFKKRTLYGLIDRQFLASTLRMFDFANPDIHIPRRAETTVPQQALFALNHPFMAIQSKALAVRFQKLEPRERVRQMFRAVYQLDPTSQQVDDALAFLESAANEPQPAVPATVLAWSYGYGKWDEAEGKLTNFKRLPHFTGTAWQGGAAYPDGKLGWAQVTGTGGHPGNDLAHACVRRWTAPTKATISITSLAKHEPAEGNGIRCSVYSSRQGLLKTSPVQHNEVAFNFENLDVEAGETIDFVVDINGELNSDQHLWAPVIVVKNETAAQSPDTTWNAITDFTGPITVYLAPWEQLSQVMLLTNEFGYVD